MNNIEIGGYEAGALGRVVELHGAYYDRHWKLGLYFEALAAKGLAEFMLGFDAARDGFWIAKSAGAAAGECAGSVSLVGPRDGGPARLRWFVVDETLQGRGVGRRLLERAMQFCRDSGYRHVYLTTFAGLDAARQLYERAGFVLTHESADNTWGRPLTEQRFDWKEG